MTTAAFSDIMYFSPLKTCSVGVMPAKKSALKTTASAPHLVNQKPNKVKPKQSGAKSGVDSSTGEDNDVEDKSLSGPYRSVSPPDRSSKPHSKGFAPELYQAQDEKRSGESSTSRSLEVHFV